MLKITDAARDYIKPLMADEPDKHLRVMFQGYG